MTSPPGWRAESCDLCEQPAATDVYPVRRTSSADYAPRGRIDTPGAAPLDCPICRSPKPARSNPVGP
jgi:hypothetical protein